MPYIGRSTDGFGVRNRFLYLASADDTSVSGADANGAILSFSDGAYVDVYLNGVLLKAGTDYNTNTANTIAGLSALASNDEVTVIVYDIFAVADTVSQSSGGTFSGAITFDSTVSGLDVNGTEIILDADGDTTITADTDDQIDIKIAGADDFAFKANTFEVQTGSNIDMNGTELILDADGDTSITADTDDRIDFKAANTDIVHILSTGMGIGTNNPAHTLELKTSAPEIMLEETSSGGSKRLSLGVASDGTPFINAEQSGGVIAMNMTGTEVARFNSNGLSFPSGKGLDFSATGDGSGANQNEIFDDYEEGTWTPALVSGGSGSITVNSSRYTRIGNLVYAGCYINFSNLPNNSTGFQMSGLPFAVIGSSNYHGGGAITFAGTFNWAGLNAFPAFTPYSGTSQFYLHTSGTTATVTYQMVNGITALIFTLIYITS